MHLFDCRPLESERAPPESLSDEAAHWARLESKSLTSEADLRQTAARVARTDQTHETTLVAMVAFRAASWCAYNWRDW